MVASHPVELRRPAAPSPHTMYVHRCFKFQITNQLVLQYQLYVHHCKFRHHLWGTTMTRSTYCSCGNKTGHTNVYVLTDVFVGTRDALGTNTCELRDCFRKKEEAVVLPAQTSQLFCSISLLFIQTRRTGTELHGF